MFPNEDAYTACNFDGATALAGTVDVNTHTYNAVATGIFYLGSSVGGDCAAGQKLTLTVTGMF